jgi:hypothetical protein
MVDMRIESYTSFPLKVRGREIMEHAFLGGNFESERGAATEEASR